MNSTEAADNLVLGNVESFKGILVTIGLIWDYSLGVELGSKRACFVTTHTHTHTQKLAVAQT